MSNMNSNYVEQEDGFHKKTTSTQKGRSPFNKPLRTSTSMNPSLFKRAYLILYVTLVIVTLIQEYHIHW